MGVYSTPQIAATYRFQKTTRNAAYLKGELSGESRRSIIASFVGGKSRKGIKSAVDRAAIAASPVDAPQKWKFAGCTNGWRD